ncbi:sigma-70 family RNA polymerase sigma factor [Pollutibacter soli]|uniref:RNA polymerase sigma factor n=1 Tax=Pollutibacter soli TaxID=3034157 RepID=UPI0030140962
MNFIRNIEASQLTDAELVHLFQKEQDLKVLAQLYERYMDLVYGVCLKYLKDTEESKDAVMQIFESLVVKLPKHDVEQFRSWLYVLAKNHCLMALRASNKQKTSTISPDLMQSGENGHLNGALEKEEQLEQMEKCMDLLPVDQKESVKLFYLEQKSYKEIADITGNEWNRVRSLIQNGRRNMKICMEKKLKEKSEL